MKCGLFFIGVTIVLLICAIILSKWITKPVQAAWESQQRFIGDASHTLKTPLAVISANAELLEESINMESDDYKRLTNITEEAKRMDYIIKGLLSMAEISKGSIPEEMVRTDLSDIIMNAAFKFEGVALENGIKLTDDIQKGMIIMGKKEKLINLADILLDNAIKYVNEQKTVFVQLKKEGRNAVIRVKNTSESLTEEQLDKIFTRFYQLHYDKGNGLGLSIARSIVDLFGGSITADYKEGMIIFTVIFRLAN